MKIHLIYLRYKYLGFQKVNPSYLDKSKTFKEAMVQSHL